MLIPYSIIHYWSTDSFIFHTYQAILRFWRIWLVLWLGEWSTENNLLMWTQLFYTRSNSSLLGKMKISHISYSNLFSFRVCTYMLFCASNSLRVQTGYISDALSSFPVLSWLQRFFHLLIHKRDARHLMHYWLPP